MLRKNYQRRKKLIKGIECKFITLLIFILNFKKLIDIAELLYGKMDSLLEDNDENEKTLTS